MRLLLVFIRPASSLSSLDMLSHPQPVLSSPHLTNFIPSRLFFSSFPSFPIGSVWTSPPRLRPLPRVDVSFCSFSLSPRPLPRPRLLSLSQGGEGKSGQLQRCRRGNSRERRRPPSRDRVKTERNNHCSVCGCTENRRQIFFFPISKKKKI